MPTQESWLDDTTIQTYWTKPLTPDELINCFTTLASWLDETDFEAHVLFDILDSGSIPSNAPILAVRSSFLNHPNVGRIAVVGMKAVPQVLARVASTVARKDIKFFPTTEDALNYIRQDMPIIEEE